jgi:hypothetical protein
MDRTHGSRGSGPDFKERLSRGVIATFKRLLWHVSPRAFESLTTPHQGQTFSIGIYRGPSPLELDEPGDLRNPILTCDHVTDVPAAFVADPFMMLHEGRWYLFMEVFNRLNRRGEIGIASSANGETWRYERIVLREPFHLAYPFLLRWRGNIYMVPDSPSRGVRLYQATRFPYAWRFKRQLISGGCFSDSTVFRHQNRWWMLTAWAPHPSAPLSLRLFGASDLAGEWQEHPESPLLANSRTGTRPAGPVFRVGERVFRVAQEGTPCYGTCVHAFEILELTETKYRERTVDSGVVVRPGSRRWHSGGMHHVNAHQVAEGDWIACVDGWYSSEQTLSN